MVNGFDRKHSGNGKLLLSCVRNAPWITRHYGQVTVPGTSSWNTKLGMHSKSWESDLCVIKLSQMISCQSQIKKCSIISMWQTFTMVLPDPIHMKFAK
jgi:hypothetical protein